MSNSKVQGLAKRQPKSQGTSKIGCYCTAQISASVDNLTGEVLVTLHKTHYGHSMQLQHLRLPLSDRLKIASQLKAGVSVDHIYDEIRDGLVSDIQ